MNWQKVLDKSVSDVRTSISLKDFRDPLVYGRWLSETYHFVRHSTALLGFALPYLREEKLRGIFEHHIGEESRHDLLALKDLERLRLNVFSPSVFTEAFYQTQYFRIQFHGGEALLGYILFLENLAVSWGKELYEEALKSHPKSVLFLKVHAEEDLSHVARARELIESLPHETQEMILENFLSSQTLYIQIISGLKFNLQRKIA